MITVISISSVSWVGLRVGIPHALDETAAELTADAVVAFNTRPTIDAADGVVAINTSVTPEAVDAVGTSEVPAEIHQGSLLVGDSL
jgi:hypothetical protein